MGYKYGRFIKKLMKTKKAIVLGEKPVAVKALLRDPISKYGSKCYKYLQRKWKY